jgi:hypothetical protein
MTINWFTSNHTNVCMAWGKGVYRVLVGKPEGKGHLEILDVDGMILLRWILRKWDVWAWTGSVWLMLRTGGRHFRMR